MAKGLKAGKLVLRLGIILFLVGLSFLITIKAIRFLWPGAGKTVTEKHMNFGIVLPSNYSIHGIDVSRHQEKIDWCRVDSMKSAGHEIFFVFIKATEGISRQDPTFNQNWNALHLTSLIRGAYHFYYPSRDAVKQAKNFTSQVKLIKGDLPPVVDIEYSNGKSRENICKNLSIFLKELEKTYKVKPIIYTNLSFYNKYLAGQFNAYPLWLSYYNSEQRFYESCNHDWTFWQHSDRGKADGIAGNVDFNVYHGSLEELKKMCIP